MLNSSQIAAVNGVIANARQLGRFTLDEVESKRVLAASGIAIPRGKFVPEHPPTPIQFDELDWPMAVKAVAPGLIHKSDRGGVLLGIVGAKAVDEAMRQIRMSLADYSLDGFLVEEMCGPGIELVIGGLIHPRFGPVVMTGLGGVFVEVFNDVILRVCPIERYDAESMLDEFRGKALLAGVRSQRPPCREAIIDALMLVGGAGGLLEICGDKVSELDINPLIAGPKMVVAADARIILGPAD